LGLIFALFAFSAVKIMDSEFEQKLSRQTLRPVPSEWRGKILSAARVVQAAPHESRVTHHSWLSTLNHQLSTIFWPHPKAWAGLAAIWIFIFAVNFFLRDPMPRVAEKSAPPSPEMVVELKKQQRLFAELIGANDLREADRQKLFLPRPRSECAEILTA
jgi:hypothetical protein